MNREELIKFLKENLGVFASLEVEPYMGPAITVKITLDGEEICSCSSSVSTSVLNSDGEYY